MTSEEFEEFTQRVEKMRDILSWAKTNSSGTYRDDSFCFAEEGGLDCDNCPLNRYKPKWVNLPKNVDICDYYNDGCTSVYKKVISIWDKENAKYALEEALDDI